MCPALREIDGQKLKAIADSSHTASVVLTYLAVDRMRNTPKTDIRRTKMALLRKGERIEDNDYTAMWKALDQLGVGTYFKGRGINESHFEWKYSLKIIAGAAISGKNVDVSGLVQPKKEAPVKKAKAPLKVISLKSIRERKVNPAKVEEKTLHVHLRNDYMVELRVPKDLSSEEATRLCRSLGHMVSR